MVKERVISEEDREITVYQEVSDSVKKQLYSFLVEFENKKDSAECVSVCKEIKDFICEQIAGCMKRGDELGAYSGRYREIGHGSTAYCYSLVENRDDSRLVLVKEFHPTLYVKEDIALCNPNGCTSIPQCGLYWIADSARDDIDKVKTFLADFARFIKQETQIVSIIKDSHKSGSDGFFAPKLYISSAGFIYLTDALCGKVLTDVISDIDKKGYSLSAIIDRFEMILRIAQSVAVYHDNKYFNGDLKPSNLFQIEVEDGQKIIRNIDFDTCINVEKDIEDKSYFSKDIRTTRIFYSPTGIQSLGKDINEKDVKTLDQARKYLLKFDVSAIANILIYAFLSKERREELINEEYELAFQEYGFYGDDEKENVAEILFDAIGCKESLSRLAIFKEIHNLIFNSLDEGNKKKYDIHKFINQLNLIIADLDCIEAPEHIKDYLKNEKDPFNKDIPKKSLIYFANLHRLDGMPKNDLTIEYEFSPNPDVNTPEDYVKKLFYTDGKEVS